MKDPTDSDPVRSEMSTRTPVVLNGWLVAFTVLLMVCVDGFGGLVMGGQLCYLANGFMFFKALRRREYQLALLYFLVAASVAALCFSLAGQYGHR